MSFTANVDALLDQAGIPADTAITRRILAGLERLVELTKDRELPPDVTRLRANYTDAERLHWYALPQDCVRGSLVEGSAEFSSRGDDGTITWRPLAGSTRPR
jgi:hypothetical protein